MVAQDDRRVGPFDRAHTSFLFYPILNGCTVWGYSEMLFRRWQMSSYLAESGAPVAEDMLEIRQDLCLRKLELVGS